MQRIAISLVAAALALALAGCGQDTNRDAVQAVTDRFYAAIADKDGAAACEQLSDATIDQLEQDEQGSCPAAIESVGLAPARIARVEVFITNAKVDLANGASAFLEQTRTGWKLSALGCRPTGGDPHENPMGCEVES